MTQITRRRLVRSGATGVLGAVAAPSVARAQTKRWRMVTSWPKRLPGPGMSAERVAERIRTLSGGRLDITVHAAGEVVPAFEVLDAVGGGVAEMGHTASFYWQGKMPAAAFFTTVPFGLTPGEHVAWVDAGGGQALWDELYAPFGVKPFMGGNTGVCMGGWFRREIKSRADLGGMKIRSLGPRRRGLSPARRHAADHAAGGNPDEPAIRRDRRASSSSAPAPTSRSASIAWRRSTTIRASTSRTAPASASCRSSAWEALDAELKAIVAHACAVEANFALAEMERLNTEALAALTGQHRVQLRAFPQDLIAAARSDQRRRAGRSWRRAAPPRRKVHDSYVAFRERAGAWSRISLKAVLEAREG